MLCFERILFGMLKRLNVQVDIEVWPVEVGAMKQFDVIGCRDLGFFEPGIVLKRQQEFLPFGV